MVGGAQGRWRRMCRWIRRIRRRGSRGVDGRSMPCRVLPRRHRGRRPRLARVRPDGHRCRRTPAVDHRRRTALAALAADDAAYVILHVGHPPGCPRGWRSPPQRDPAVRVAAMSVFGAGAGSGVDAVAAPMPSTARCSGDLGCAAARGRLVVVPEPVAYAGGGVARLAGERATSRVLSQTPSAVAGDCSPQAAGRRWR